MKRLLISIVIVLGVIPGVFAQSETTSFMVDGIKVIFKPTVKDVINVRLFFRGGVANYPASQAGIEKFALTATLQCGTQQYNAQAFRDSTDAYGIDIGAGADLDFGDIDMDCISKYFDRAWDLLTQAVVNPSFEDNEVELLKNKLVAEAKAGVTNPDNYARLLVLQNAFETTPYATNPAGTEETISKLSANDIKNYYKSILNKKQLFIVIAGKITKEELIAKIHASFSGLPSRHYAQPDLREPVWNDGKIITENRQLSTNYIYGIMNSPLVASDDYVPYRLGITILGSVLFQDLRSRLNLSYDPGAFSQMQQMPYAVMYISTNDPKAAVKEMVNMFKLLGGREISASTLEHLKNSYITTSYIRQQSTASITSSLGVAEILGALDKEENLPALVNKVTADQIAIVLTKYIKGLRWSYLGNADMEQEAEAAHVFQDKLN